MALITYPDKSPGDQFFGTEATEIKTVVNANVADALSITLASAQSITSDLGIGVTPINALDVNGGAAIGASYAGISTAPVDGMLIEGNVIIGDTLTSSVYKLSVVSNDILAYFEGSDANFFLRNNVANIISLQSSAGDGFTFNTNGPNERLRIASDGNIGIGTPSPKTSLHVNGAITQNELSADPTDPLEGSFVDWMSDGTGSGDDGDIMRKITAGGVTKITTVTDFSALP